LGEENAEPDSLTENTMDSILARELHQLSLEDREAINEEIHGVRTLAVPETSGFVSEKLEEMERSLLQIRHRQHIASDDDNGGKVVGDAYREALLLGSRYIHDPNLRLMFLRANFFDASRAALRLVTFLQLLRDNLGPEALVNIPWTLQMFGTHDLKALKSGVFQIFPGRDRAGRRVHGIMDDPGEAKLLTIVSNDTMYHDCADRVCVSLSPLFHPPPPSLSMCWCHQCSSSYFFTWAWPLLTRM
jgi:hypothetical protein